MNFTAYYPNARRDDHKIALTFDDGPNPHATPKILDILKAKAVRGTFFMIGAQVEAEPELAKRVMEAGHVIGNHTYTHPRAYDNQGVAFWQDNFMRAEQAIQSVTGKATGFIRLPYLAYSGDVSGALRAWDSHRPLIDGDIDPHDWMHNLEVPLPPQKIIDAIFGSPSLGNGSIIVLHDGSDKAEERPWRADSTVAALPFIIDGLRARGYQPVGVDEMSFDSSCAVPIVGN